MECTERLSGGKYFPGIVRSEDCSFVHSREIETSYIQTHTGQSQESTWGNISATIDSTCGSIDEGYLLARNDDVDDLSIYSGTCNNGINSF